MLSLSYAAARYYEPEKTFGGNTTGQAIGGNRALEEEKGMEIALNAVKA